jgi:hypothetical protein
MGSGHAGRPAAPARIVSGGQTGADRAALDVARSRGIAYGGWCPRGGRAEDLLNPPGLLDVYPDLRPTPLADPAQRTAWNVRDSDGTLIVVARTPWSSPGTDLTARLARELGRPLLIVATDDPAAVDRVAPFVSALGPDATLNVAGPRESQSPGIYPACRRLLDDLIEALTLPETPAGGGR